MDVKKWVPWNWFKKEEESEGNTIPVKRQHLQDIWYTENPIQQFHRELDRMLDQTFRGVGPGPFISDRPQMPGLIEGVFKPTLDLGATDKEYTISVEIPGVDEKDIKLEISDNTLTVRGEKRHEDEEKGKNYYRKERSYGSFQRILSLPEDVDQDNVQATFDKGILKVTAPRKAIPKAEVKQIEVKSA